MHRYLHTGGMRGRTQAAGGLDATRRELPHTVIPQTRTAGRARGVWVAGAMLAGFAVAFGAGRALAHGEPGAPPATTTFRMQAVGTAARPLATRPAPGRALDLVARIPALAPATLAPPVLPTLPSPAPPPSPPPPAATGGSANFPPKPLPAPPAPPPQAPVFHEHS